MTTKLFIILVGILVLLSVLVVWYAVPKIWLLVVIVIFYVVCEGYLLWRADNGR